MKPTPQTDSPAKPSSLDALLAPRSVAVIGATDDVARIGGRPLDYLLRGKFAGRIVAINPRREQVQGIATLPSVEAMDEAVDLAIIAVPGAAVESTLIACAERGIGGAVVFSSGFAELGEDGAGAQARITAIARGSGMRILGPNCLGLYNASIGLYATFSTTIGLGFPTPGPVGVVSQSGAYGAHLAYLARFRDIHVGTLVTTGNECDVELAECIAWMAMREEIRVIAAVAEGPRDGLALRRALELARAQHKPVVFLKMGRSQVGAQAAASHTASLAGQDEVYDAVLASHGVWRATDTDELLDIAYAACVGVLPASRRLGVITVSGGAGIQLADAAQRYAVDMPPMPAATQARLRERLPYASPLNPVDITAQVLNDPELLPLNLYAMLEEGGYDTIIAFFTYAATVAPLAEALLGIMAEIRERYPDRLLVQCVVASRAFLERYEAMGSPCFEDPDRAVRAVAALAWFGRVLAEPPTALPQASTKQLAAGIQDELQSVETLVAAGFPRPPVHLVHDARQAGEVARQLGVPVALKICAAEILHKSDLGAVALNVSGDEAVIAAHNSIIERVHTACPTADYRGVLVAPMAPSGLDMILGVNRDPVFGAIVMVGVGGVFVEIMDDVSLAPVPVDMAGARAMVEDLRAWPLLQGARGSGARDVDALCQCIVALSRFAEEMGESLHSIDVNPLRVFAAGEGVRILDAVVIPAD